MKGLCLNLTIISLVVSSSGVTLSIYFFSCAIFLIASFFLQAYLIIKTFSSLSQRSSKINGASFV